jgi:hypothetical protein
MVTRMVVQTTLWLTAMGAILFLAAGDWRWPLIEGYPVSGIHLEMHVSTMPPVTGDNCLSHLEPDSKGNYRASRLTAIWMQASVTKAARVRPRFS